MTDPYAYDSSRPPAPASTANPGVRTADAVVTVVLLVVIGLAALVVTVLALLADFLVDAADGSGSFLAGVLLPTWGIYVVAAAASAWLIARKRLSFWVPLVSVVVWFLLVTVFTIG